MEHDEQVTEIPANPSALALLNASEIDQQIATAHKFPRSVKRFRDEALQMVTLTEAIATECIYALPRDGKVIEGPSARFAEIVVSAWRNCRAGARVVNEDGEFVTSQGVFHDLEHNVAITYEVKRRIVDRNGRRYRPDMIGTTANAACSIALRNAILKGIPKAFWSDLYAAARKTAAGDFKTLANRRADALKAFVIYGVKPEQIFGVLGVKGDEDITIDHLVTLKGMLTALQEGDSTPEQMFGSQESGIQKPRAKSAGNGEQNPEQTQAAQPVQGKQDATPPRNVAPKIDDGPFQDPLINIIKAKLGAAEIGEHELFRAFRVEGWDGLRVSQLDAVLSWVRNPR